MVKVRPAGIFIAAIIVIGIIIRIACTVKYAIVDSDTAVFCLMAKHIFHLKEFPIYEWGAHYAGTLACYTGAVFFKFFGISALSYSMMKALFTCILIAVNLILAREVLDKRGFIAASFMIILPSIWVITCSLMETLSEMLIFGSLILWLLVKWNKKEGGHGDLDCPVIGFLCGIGLWIQPASIPFALTAAAVFITGKRRSAFPRALVFFAAGLLIGFLPGIIYSIQYPGASLLRFAGRVLDLDRTVLSSPNLMQIVSGKVLWRISAIPGYFFDIPYRLSRLAGTLSSLVFLVSLLWVIARNGLTVSSGKRLSDLGVLTIFIIFFVIFYATLVGEDHPRYMLPLAIVMPIFIGKFLSDIFTKRSIVAVILLSAIVLTSCHDAGAAILHEREYNYGELARWLDSKDIRYGYSDYWTAFPVMFESNEKVIISPTLFKPAHDDRYPAYTQAVRDAKEQAFIIDRSMYPLAVAEMERYLAYSGISYKKDRVRDFIIFHHLGRMVYPDELKFTGSMYFDKE
jgi:hypothetical protein